MDKKQREKMIEECILMRCDLEGVELDCVENDSPYISMLEGFSEEKLEFEHNWLIDMMYK